MWVLLALFTALATAGRETLIKSIMRDGDEAAVAFVISATASLVLFPLVFASFAAGDGAPALAPDFAWALLVSGGLNTAVMLMIARAVHRSDLSLVSPLQSTTPVFIVLTGWLLLGEVPAAAGAAGIAIVVVGAWVLSVQEGAGERSAGRAGPFPSVRRVSAPFGALARDSGARLFLGVAVLYAISGTVDKVGVLASTPLVWAAALNGFVALALVPVLIVGDGVARVRRLLATAPRRALLAGLALGAGAAAQMAALPLTLVAYVIAVKRTSVLFSVLAGALIFRERSLKRRLGGAAIMLGGFLLITLAG